MNVPTSFLWILKVRKREGWSKQLIVLEFNIYIAGVEFVRIEQCTNKSEYFLKCDYLRESLCCSLCICYKINSPVRQRW